MFMSKNFMGVNLQVVEFIFFFIQVMYQLDLTKNLSSNVNKL